MEKLSDVIRRVIASVDMGDSRDLRDPRPEGTYTHPIFRDHNCWKCRNGQKPCPNNYRNCGYPHARND